MASNATEVTIYGPAFSTYVRSARMACVEKGLPYELQPVEFRSEEHYSLHPFGKVPAFRHGDFTIWETAAIGTYIDRAFDGPPLRPKGAKEEARMTAWISSTADYIYPAIVRTIIQERFAERFGRKTNEEKIAESLPRAAEIMRILENQLTRSAHFAGEDLSLADLVIYPIMDYLLILPEASLFDRAPHVKKWLSALAQRKSATSTRPL